MLSKKDCYNNTTWDYLGWKDSKQELFDFDQTEWLSTLIFTINGMSALIHKESYMGGVNTITINSKLLGLFALIPLGNYDHDKQTLCGRYHLVIDDNLDENIIFLSHIPKAPLKALPIKVGLNDDVVYKWHTVELLSCEEIELYKSKLNAYIEILNINNMI